MSDFFQVFEGLLQPDEVFWFRGQSDFTWSLAPSALRYHKRHDREKALGLLKDFKRVAQLKLNQPPKADEELLWLQTARHYGLPTRLLDWSQNVMIALYFACLQPDADGLVFVINPVDLNRSADPHRPRVFDANLDADIINKYLGLDGERRSAGLPTIAINPIWNSERIVLQKGAFTLHGSRNFSLNSRQAPSLVAVPVLSKNKARLRNELARVGVDEMSIFPEPEHICRQLIDAARL